MGVGPARTGLRPGIGNFPGHDATRDSPSFRRTIQYPGTDAARYPGRTAYIYLNARSARTPHAGHTQLLPNGDFETDIDNWYGNRGTETLSRDLAVFHDGAAALKCITPGNTYYEGVRPDTAPGLALVSASTQYTMSAYIKGSSGVHIQIGVLEFLASNGFYYNELFGPIVTLTGNWQLVTFTFTTEVGVGKVAPEFLTDDILATTFWVDSVRVESGAARDPGLFPSTSLFPGGTARQHVRTTLMAGLGTLIHAFTKAVGRTTMLEGTGQLSSAPLASSAVRTTMSEVVELEALDLTVDLANVDGVVELESLDRVVEL